MNSIYKLPRPSGTPSKFEGDIPPPAPASGGHLPSPFTLHPFSLSPLILFFLLLFSFLPCSAQESNLPLPQSMQKELPVQKKRPMLTAGGGFGFQFGFYNEIKVAPFFGVYATPWLVALVNGQYSFMWSRFNYNAHIWSVGAALEPIIIKKIVIHAGYEFEQVRFTWLDGSSTKEQNFHNVVVGAGYKQYMSEKIYFQGLILFNIPLNQHSIQNFNYNYYPFFRINIGVDF